MTNEWLVPTVEDAAIQYRAAILDLLIENDIDDCLNCCNWAATIEAASVALDMAFALASEERIRASIAWA